MTKVQFTVTKVETGEIDERFAPKVSAVVKCENYNELYRLDGLDSITWAAKILKEAGLRKALPYKTRAPDWNVGYNPQPAWGIGYYPTIEGRALIKIYGNSDVNDIVELLGKQPTLFKYTAAGYIHVTN